MFETEAGSNGALWANQTWVNLSNSTDNFLLNSISDKEKEMVREEKVQPLDHLESQDALDDKKTMSKKRGGSGGGGGGGLKRHKGKGKLSSDEVEGDDHELHIFTERERRKKMRNMFANLHALLPQLPSKADKSTIVDEAVSYIKRLEITLQSLQQQKREKIRCCSVPNGSTMVNYNQSPMLINLQNVVYDPREAILASSNNTTTANGFNNTNSSDFNALNSSLSASSSSLSSGPLVFETWTSPNVVLNMCRNEAQISVCTPKKAGLFFKICNILEKYKLVVTTAHLNSDSHRTMYMIQAQPSSAPDNQLLEMFPAQEIFKQAVSEINLCVTSGF